MNILIITYSKEINPGTFLQAYGVQHGLKTLFPNATIHYLNYKKIIKGTGGEFVKLGYIDRIKSIVNAIPRRLKYLSAQKKHFRYTTEVFDLFENDEHSLERLLSIYDQIFVGSDTILEGLKNSSGKYGVMWVPMKVKSKKHFFAASASPANFNLSEEDISHLRPLINEFTYIGLRDSLTISLFKDKLNINPDRILKQPDPTFLIPDSDVSFPLDQYKLIKEAKEKGRKIALVNFNKNFSGNRDFVSLIQSRGFYVISTIYNPYSDANLCQLNPFKWAGVFSHIDVAVTERFHDTVFSLRNEKYVIAVDWNVERFSTLGASKTLCILSDYNLEHQHINCKTERYTDKLCQLLDTYLTTGHSVEKIRNKNISQKEDYNTILEIIRPNG